MERTELEGFKVRELQKMATSMGISHSRDLKKAEVIEAILKTQKLETKQSTEVGSVQEEVQIDDNGTDVEAGNKVEKNGADVKVDTEQKASYLESANVGTLVAFRLPDGKVKSAMITRKSTKGRKFELKTDYGAVYIASYDDIIWVRTGKRWPRGVYNLLKGEV